MPTGELQQRVVMWGRRAVAVAVAVVVVAGGGGSGS